MSKKSTLIQIAVSLLVVAGGIGIYTAMVKTKPEPKQRNRPPRGAMVEVATANRVEKNVKIEVMGTVIPSKTVTVIPEVGGRIVSMNPELVPGGRISAGDEIISIDPRDYDLAVRQAQAKVSAAELALAQEHGLKAVAEREWEMIKDEVQPTEDGRRLALREVQFENAKVALDSARGALDQARLARSRVVIKAPFNALVQGESAEVGQVVGPGVPLATLVDRDVFWVRVAVPVDQLRWMRFPTAEQDGSSATVLADMAPGVVLRRLGRVVQLQADLDTRGQMARVLVAVDGPMNPVLAPDATEGESGDVHPLLLGTRVRVEIDGPVVNDVFELQRRAIRDNGVVWIRDADGKLAFRNITIVWTADDMVYATGNLQQNEQVVVSRLSVPVAGMALSLPSAQVVDADKANTAQVVPEQKHDSAEKPEGESR